MQCPIDGTPLVTSDRQGVEIDYCPTCRGIWLDRGELDKIIERSNAEPPAPPRSSYDEDYSEERPHAAKRNHPRSFLEDIFDF